MVNAQLEEGTVAKKLAISPDLKLPADTVTATVIVYGGKGMGKTNFGSVLAEELAAAGLKFAWLDPPGVSWGLRHSADGKGRGIEVLILGGPHGDIPIEPTAGAVVADLVVDNDVNVVIDISRKPDGTMWSIADRVRFVTAYAKRLYQRQGEKRRPIMQVLDEAARFIPQIVRSGDAEVAACMGALAVLVEEGRNVGIGVTFITQRSARLNKDVAELADCMVAFRTVGPNSRRAVMDWLGEHVEKERLRELDDAVRKLPVGSALVVSPGWLEFEGVVKMRARETFDSSATPKPGETRKASGPGAKPDLAKYQTLMAETIERAKADDPRELRRRIKELEGQVVKAAKAAPAAPAPAKQKRVEVPILKDGHIARLEALAVMAAKASEDLRTAASDALAAVHRALATPGPSLAAVPPKAPLANRPPPPRPHRDPPPTNGDAPNLRRGERKILEVAARSHPAKRTWAQLATLAGFTASGGTFGTYMGVLKRNGFLVEEPGDLWDITPAGFEEIGEVPKAPMSRDEVLATWRKALRAGERKILDYLLEKFPEWTTKIELAERTGFTADGGTFGTYVGVLVRNGLAEKQGRGEDEKIRAGQALFLDA